MKEQFCVKLSRLITQAGTTSYQFSRKIGRSKCYLNQVIGNRYKMPAETAKKVANALGITFEQLIADTDYHEPLDAPAGTKRKRKTCLLNTKCTLGSGQCCEKCSIKAQCKDACQNNRETCSMGR